LTTALIVDTAGHVPRSQVISFSFTHLTLPADTPPGRFLWVASSEKKKKNKTKEKKKKKNERRK
ncbi:hypothetical protein, partial [Aeromonas salmonicida]|uniref:hypothetical protein n=1 Tax=Aeromonas salmonicida TaxID=645 RepID=UPI003D3172CC